MERQIEKANFVLVVCTEIYKRRYEGRKEVGKGHGTTWEAILTRQELYEGQVDNEKFIPVVFIEEASSEAEAFDPKRIIPKPLRPFTYYCLMGDYNKLLRSLTNQPSVIPNPIGPRQVMPPDPTSGLPFQESPPTGNLCGREVANSSSVSADDRDASRFILERFKQLSLAVASARSTHDALETLFSMAGTGIDLFVIPGYPLSDFLLDSDLPERVDLKKRAIVAPPTWAANVPDSISYCAHRRTQKELVRLLASRRWRVKSIDVAVNPSMQFMCEALQFDYSYGFLFRADAAQGEDPPNAIIMNYINALSYYLVTSQ